MDITVDGTAVEVELRGFLVARIGQGPWEPLGVELVRMELATVDAVNLHQAEVEAAVRQIVVGG